MANIRISSIKVVIVRYLQLLVGVTGAGLVGVSLGMTGPIAAATQPPPATAASSVAASAPTGGPSKIKVKWDWTMPPSMIDKTTFVEATQSTIPGPDGIPDSPMKAVPGYPQAGKARYGTIPDDNKHLVMLHGDRSSGVGRLSCTWTIKSKPQVKRANRNCVKPLAVRLPEGTHRLTLKVRDRNGAKALSSQITVKNVLMNIMGDSYASGEGFPPFHGPDVDGRPTTAWDEPACNRSRWSGFVRSALAVEEADKRSNVTLIDVACAGAQVEEAAEVGVSASGGLLSPQQQLVPNTLSGNYMPPQVDQLRAIAKKRSWDVSLLSIGGNDVGLSPIIKTCLVDDVIIGKGNCYMLPVAGSTSTRPLYEVVDDSLTVVQQRFAALAPCFGAKGGDANCATVKVVNNAPAANATPSKPVKFGSIKNMVQAMYPDLTQQPDGSGGTTACTLTNPLSTPLNPVDNTWAYGALYQGQVGKPIPLPTTFTEYTTPNPNPVVPTEPGLVPILKNNRSTYGWRIGLSLLRASHPHGVCAPDAWEYGVNDVATNPVNNPSAALHPNDEGQAQYEKMLGPISVKIAGVPVKR